MRHIERGALPAGALTLVWDGRDAAGAELASGTYFSRLRVDGRNLVGPKLTLLR